ncbi:unnamed protein product [Pseudo-nitzschia multistriata]|uniref:Photolyase/cryptochrome alpha/beta domain-containing protein n=1 Tax=Pseudo-nitzschia multistriata TaxID=183589 RepID=A0A448YUA1_9STRA|nr:unnamed protein product [Pseudo-nitzschia multistriata]
MEDKLLLDSLNLPGCLRDRILCRVSPPPVPRNAGAMGTNASGDPGGGSERRAGSFVLYLPTVVLRKRHNPGFALACRLSNHYGVPLLVLATVLDDKHLGRTPLSPVAMTSRRLAFTLEALRESCCPDWESHGAGVAVRVHGEGCRTPHHLSLAHVAAAVVGDEPFVEPYRTYVRRVAKTCRAASVPFWTVDGSTSVPPNPRLARKPPPPAAASAVMDGDVAFSGAPSKAWRWEKATDSVRLYHVTGAHRDKALEAPDLECRLPPDFFLDKPAENTAEEPAADSQTHALHTEHSDGESCWHRLRRAIPPKWTDRQTPAPGQRPWTVSELREITDCKAWALEWGGADASVPPCKQTHGSGAAARKRWRSFLVSGLKDYAKKRNGIANPHAVSRVSCYLNLGILSIFDVLHDVWEARATRGFATGCNKFLEEVVKWREGSYVHAFAHPNYHSEEVLPAWALKDLSGAGANASGKPSGSWYGYEQLESAASRDETWNAMQEYLIETGELHNNARMTWGKTVVHWQKEGFAPGEVVWQLCCLNDRFALDGLSPPSYGGILWCFGWQDKPAGGNQKVSEKWAHRYRTGPSGFRRAREALLCGGSGVVDSVGVDRPGPSPIARKRSYGEVSGAQSPRKKTSRDATNERSEKTSSKNSILSYFGQIG